ncbi:uncharacterized protein Z518_05323 [Rhinocladiella mackenziei CBS 650.93]|uniref:Uncharacterized protein n=1 Tax=Rhinocladiella mackenziei CBS 650.93 TaxID=1442369 RepID=A0A0D2J5Y3_9EURO|nr:uncharacterized protein Z518_05323 [Rhinocladiella mackenziei CBS 650.93]KIX04455.1 hypothetical protein Z518_05323 [Rhinocladiella mackenziei CBS 650.93]
MVLLGGLEIVAAGYLLKEIGKDDEEEREREREREKRRRREGKRRHHSHSRNDHRPHRDDDKYDSPPWHSSRLSQQQMQQLQVLQPPQLPGGLPRPYSAPPPQSRPTVMPVGVPAWQGRPQSGPQMPPLQPGLPQSHGTRPLQKPPMPMPVPVQPLQQPSSQQWQQQGRPQQPPGPSPQPNGNSNFIPPPLQRPATMNMMYPPPGVHVDLKTGKIQYDMLPPEMPRGQGSEKRESERVRENSMPSRNGSQSQFPIYEEQQPTWPQPQINVTVPTQHPDQGGGGRPSFSSPAPPPLQGYAELDAETPGRYRPYRNEKAAFGRPKANSFSNAHHNPSLYARVDDDSDVDMRDPPPAYRE